MHIKKSLPRERFTKISNEVWCDETLTDGAKVLYGFLASLPNGKTIHDGYIVKCLGTSSAMVTRRKRELKEAGLLLMVQLAPRVYDLYIGYPGYPASRVQAVWENEDG
jgi:hypothetical protein